MLTNDQVSALRVAFEKIANPVTEYIIQDVARRVSQAGQLTSTAAYQIWRAQNLGMSRKEIEKAVATILKKSNAEVKKLFRQAAEVGYRFDLDQLPTSEAIPFEDNASIQQIVEAAVALADESFQNITQTLGFQTPDGTVHPLLDAYQKTTDFAFQQVITGATDYNTAIRRACSKLAANGVRSIDYASGVHTSLEAAIRRNMMGGLGLMVEQISQKNHDDLGADGWELSAHANSAPDHEPFQGKQYTDEQYQALNNMLIRRIGTLNCGHNAFPVILGVNEPQHTKEELAKFRADNEKGVTVDGRHYTGYEATQMQRKIERSIRAQKRRVLAAEASGDKETLTIAQIRLQRLRQEYGRFSKAAGLRTENERAQVAGFGKGQAARASGAIRKIGAENAYLYELDISRRATLRKHPEYALPSADKALLQDEKFTKYLFNTENPRGWAKGVAFQSRLGYNADNWMELQAEIQSRAPLFPAKPKGDAGHGMTYEQKLILFGKNNTPANVVVSWIVEDGRPRMTSAYIKEVKGHGH